MVYRPLAHGCEDGPCGAFYQDPDSGDVLVQGYETGERPVDTDGQPITAPSGEGFLMIPAGQWRTLRSRLPRA